MKNEILDTKTGRRYKVARGFFGGLKLVETWNPKHQRFVTRFGTSGLIFDEEHVKTKLRKPKTTGFKKIEEEP